MQPIAETISSTAMSTSTPIPRDDKAHYLPTTAAYDLWSTVYDNDGNFLQALDTLEMQRLLPFALSMLPPPPHQQTEPLRLVLVDLGCGTGRNTAGLLEFAGGGDEEAEVVALDASPKMLEICADRFRGARNLRCEVFDMLSTTGLPLRLQHAASLVVSTLVLEHVPLGCFFGILDTLVRPGGLLVLTNMHEDMGRVSQAGFVDERGRKVRPVSYNHSVAAVLVEAERWGWEVVLPQDAEGGTEEGKGIREVMVDDDLAVVLGKRASKWVGVRVWFGGVLRKKVA